MAVVCVLLTLAACSVKPGIEEAPLPPTPENGWSATGGTEAASKPLTSDWLSEFDSPVLSALVAEALVYNNDLGAAVARVDAARATFRATGAARFPTIGGNFSATRARFPTGIGDTTDPSGFVGVPGAVGASTFAWALQSNWEIDVWGRVRDTTRAARADADAAIQDLVDTQLSLAGMVANAWFTLIEAHQQVALARRDVENRQRSLRLIRRRFQIGLSDILDLRVARSDLSGVEAGLAADEQTLKESARALEILLGRYPSAELEYPDELPSLPLLTGAGLPVELLARRPDLRAAERRVASAGLNVRAARKELLPRLSLSGSLGPTTSSVADVIDLDEVAGNIVGGLTQPIFQGGQLLANIRAARARAEEALYVYAAAALTAYQEVENALDAEVLLEKQERALALSAQEARASEALTERDYAQGLANIFDLLDAQARTINAEGAFLTVRRTRLTNRVQLQVALAAPITADLRPADQDDQTP